MRKAMTGGIRARLLILVIGITLPLAYVGLAGLVAMWESSRKQLDDSVKKQAELAEVPGVGLGLYLAHTIIEEIGGRICVESHVGRGSTFTIYLPVWKAERQDDAIYSRK